MNTAKAAFRAICALLQRVRMRAPVKGDDGPTKATPPEVNYPAPADELADQPRRIRQSSLEAEPFLQSIPAYRYVHR
jgi:hypothetical protein